MPGMELFFVGLLVLTMAAALAMGFPVAFALPGSAIVTIALASLAGFTFLGDVSAFFHQDGPVQWLTAGVTNFRGVYWEVERDTLIAIPLFVFMGIMLQRSKIAEDLLVTMAQLFGPVPGGLGISVVLVGALLAATTGIVGATVVAMGLISLPAMLRNNYSKQLAAGTICASGTLGQIIPPSIVLIILADQLASATDQASTLRKTEYKHGTGEFNMPSEFDVTSTSAGDMFLGAFLPGLVLVSLYVLYILCAALLRPQLAPPVPYEGKYDRQFALRVLLALVPPLTLILAVLGSIILGIATVNQAGAIGAVGATIMAGYRLAAGQRAAYWPAFLAAASVASLLILLNYFELNVKNIRDGHDALGIVLATIATAGLVAAFLWSAWRTFKIEDTLGSVMLDTAKTTSMVFIILLGAAMLTAAFRSFGGEVLVREFLTGLPGGFWSQMIVVMAVIFVLGFFLDFIEIAVVVVPIVAPILLSDPSANVTAVWLGVMIGVNIQTSFLTPPFGFALFYLRGVATQAVRTIEIYRGVIAFILLQLTALVIVGIFPALVNYLPYRTTLLAETAPPPINPRLQHCIEEELFEVYAEQEEQLKASIGSAGSMDLDALPADQREGFANSIEAAARTFQLIAQVRDASSAVAAYVPEYRPLHHSVRRIQAEIRDIDVEIKEIENSLRRLRRSGESESEAGLAAQGSLARLQEQKAALATTIPEEWEDARKQYVTLAGDEKKARLTYRRNVDEAYETIAILRATLASAPALHALTDGFAALFTTVHDAEGKVAIDALRKFERELYPVAESGDIRSLLTKARRALTRNDDRDKAMELIGEAIKLHTHEAEWRLQASRSLADDLAAFEQSIRYTIGLRKQPRLTRSQATTVAACLSSHRDISLNF